MGLLTDIAYCVAAIATLPFWLTRMALAGKLRTDWPARFGRTPTWPRRKGRRRLLIHAVSVGEVNAIRHLVAALAPDAGLEIVITATTDTGTARARALYGANHRVERYPFDLSRCVRRFFDAMQPDAVALTELEVWPNFVKECRRRGIPVAVINGRLSDRSEGRYRIARPFVRSSFASLSLVLAQSERYAERFRLMGVPADRVRVEGTMKWDTAEIADEVSGSAALADLLGVDRSRPLVVAGSTAPGEEAMLLQALPEQVQLLCAPRKPEWFDRAARALPGCVRRSTATGGALDREGGTRGELERPESDRGGHDSRRDMHGSTPSTRPRLFLLDSIGDLRKAYALADVVVVGRTFALSKRFGGSDMMEPVALGKATIVGPDCANFDETARALLDAQGLVQCSAGELKGVLASLIGDQRARETLAARGREVIRREQGASRRTAARLLALMPHAALPTPTVASSGGLASVGRSHPGSGEHHG